MNVFSLVYSDITPIDTMFTTELEMKIPKLKSETLTFFNERYG